MKTNVTVLALVFACMIASLDFNPLYGHNAFKKVMDQKYDGLKINCNACHVEGEEKEVRNLFGQLFHRELESEKLSENWNAKRGRERREYEQEVMVPAFEKALEKVSAMTYADIINTGLVDGMELKEQTSLNPGLPNQLMFVSMVIGNSVEPADRPKSAAWKKRIFEQATRKLRRF